MVTNMKSAELKALLYMALVMISLIMLIFLGLVAKEAYTLLGQRILFYISINSSEALIYISLIAVFLISAMTFTFICTKLTYENEKKQFIYSLLFVLSAVLAAAFCFLVAQQGATARTDMWVLLTTIMSGTWKILVALLVVGIMALQ